MTTATLRPTRLASTPSSNVGTALRELAGAAHRLALALWAATVDRTRAQSQEASAFEAAAELRTFASSLPASDHSFAEDLYAAADRHEMINQA
jgi:hypothetical protein